MNRKSIYQNKWGNSRDKGFCIYPYTMAKIFVFMQRTYMCSEYNVVYYRYEQIAEVLLVLA